VAKKGLKQLLPIGTVQQVCTVCRHTPFATTFTSKHTQVLHIKHVQQGDIMLLAYTLA